MTAASRSRTLDDVNGPELAVILAGRLIHLGVFAGVYFGALTFGLPFAGLAIGGLAVVDAAARAHGRSMSGGAR